MGTPLTCGDLTNTVVAMVTVRRATAEDATAIVELNRLYNGDNAAVELSSTPGHPAGSGAAIGYRGGRFTELAATGRDDSGGPPPDVHLPPDLLARLLFGPGNVLDLENDPLVPLLTGIGNQHEKNFVN
jgi:hypothetical protein